MNSTFETTLRSGLRVKFECIAKADEEGGFILRIFYAGEPSSLDLKEADEIGEVWMHSVVDGEPVGERGPITILGRESREAFE